MTEIKKNEINGRFWHKNGGFPAALRDCDPLSPLTNHLIGWTAKVSYTLQPNITSLFLLNSKAANGTNIFFREIKTALKNSSV
jgi:hypothetical protein